MKTTVISNTPVYQYTVLCKCMMKLEFMHVVNMKKIKETTFNVNKNEKIII